MTVFCGLDRQLWSPLDFFLQGAHDLENRTSFVLTWYSAFLGVVMELALQSELFWKVLSTIPLFVLGGWGNTAHILDQQIFCLWLMYLKTLVNEYLGIYIFACSENFLELDSTITCISNIWDSIFRYISWRNIVWCEEGLLVPFVKWPI